MQHAADRLKVLKSSTPATSAEIRKQNEQLQSVYNDVASVVASSGTLAEALGSSFKAELMDTIQFGFSLSFSGIGAPKKKENIHLKRINDILAGLGPDIPAPLREQFDTIRRQADEITGVDYLENFCSVVVTPFAKACRECEGYDDAVARYQLLAAEAHVTAQHFDCSAEGLKAMKEASEQLEAAIMSDRERTYIAEALDASMREMGYEMIGDRVVAKRTGKRIRHELYMLHAGTAVDVTYADNGQISMELGGIGHSDRQPTAAESEQLVDDMRSFCQDYATLEKKLAERGVMTAHISHMPPAVEYAQIFNANDYEMTKPVETYQAEAQHKQAAKAMHKE